MTRSDARFVALYERYYRHVYAYCRRRTGLDRTDDAVADVFLVVWRRIDDVPEGEAALPWIYRVAHNVLGHQFRSLGRKRKLDHKLNSLGVEPEPNTEEVLVLRQEAQAVLVALDSLKPVDQEVLKLSIWEELPHSDIANVLEVSVDTAKQRLSRARKRLAREFERLESSGFKSPAAQKGGLL